MAHLPRIASLIFNRAHYITPEAADAILHALDGRIGEMGMSRFTGDPAVTERGRWAGFSITTTGVAVVPIIGELVNRGAYLGAESGLVSYEGVRQQLRNAAADPRVKAIVLDIDSPGGMTSGMAETAALVGAIAKEKPVTAVANSLMASAAYGIASGANRIVATPSSMIGSIGVLYIHADRSGEMARRGIKMTLIHAGAKKVDGHPFAPLPDHVRADIQTLVNNTYGAFVSIVAAGRLRLSERQIRDTEASVYLARDAVAHGLADILGPFEEAVEAAVAAKTFAVRAVSTGDRQAMYATSPPAPALPGAGLRARVDRAAQTTTPSHDEPASGRRPSALGASFDKWFAQSTEGLKPAGADAGAPAASGLGAAAEKLIAGMRPTQGEPSERAKVSRGATHRATSGLEAAANHLIAKSGQVHRR